MKTHCLKPFLCGLLMAAAQCSQAEVGLGVSLQPTGHELYVPISLSDSYRIEPSLYYENHGNSAQISHRQFIELSVGFFQIAPVGDKVSAYYGARAGFLDYNSSSHIGDDLEGARFAPTVGIEYFLSSRLSISGEAAISYERIDSQSSGHREETKTTTDILLRYMF